MNIVLLNTYEDWGGDEQWTLNLGKGLSEKGHEIIVACDPGSELEKKARVANLKVYSFKAGSDIAYWKIPKYRSFFRANKTDVVICSQNRDVKIGALAAKLEGVKLVLGRQALAMLKKNRMFHRVAFTRFIDGMITNSQALKDLYMTYGWFTEDFIHVLYDGLNLPSKIGTIDLHQTYDLIPNSKVIIGTGRLVEQKRFDLLIQVARLAKDKNLNWSFLIAGQGRLGSKLMKMAQNLEVDEHIKFIGFTENVLPIMKSGDIFVLSSDAEGMSNALREAMSVGLPCIATDVFGVDELFEEGRCGIKIKCGDHEAIYSALYKLFSDEKLRTEISANAIDKIKNDFSMDLMINNFEALLKRLLAKKGIEIEV